MSLRVKKALKKLVAYSPDDVDFEIRLNANEAPFDFIIDEVRSLKNSKAKKYLNELSLIENKAHIEKFYKSNQGASDRFMDQMANNNFLELNNK